MYKEEYRFLCDEMLKGLARWLRAAGYDTEINQHDQGDREMLNQAIKEGRWLVSRDRKLLEMRQAIGHVIVLRSNSLATCAEELATGLDINWIFNPFSRCLRCNQILVLAKSNQLFRIPETSRKHLSNAFYCESCDKLYWDGSHTRRMRVRLQAWQEGRY